MMRTRIGSVTPSFWALSACACALGKTVTAPANAGPAGVWELVRVNAAPVPVTIASDGTEIRILSEEIILRSDQSFAMFTIEKVGDVASPAPADTVNNLGYWGVTSGDLLIGITPATQRGDTLAITSNSRGVSVYARR